MKNRPVEILSHALSAFLCLLLVLVPCAVSAFDREAEIHFSQALKLKQEGNFLAAERHLRKAIELEPENPDFHFELGNLYTERENWAAARSAYEQAVMIAPWHIPSNFNLGLVYEELGFMSEARDQFRRVLDLDPSNQKAQLQIGYTYQQQGFVEEARDAFRAAQDMDISNPEPQAALEDLREYEARAQEKSSADLQQSFLSRRRLLNGQDPWSLQEGMNGDTQARSQTSTRGAMMQAGVLLLQQLLQRRAANQQTESGDNS